MKVAVVVWFTPGDAGDKAKGVTSEIVPDVCACALLAGSSVDDRVPLTSSPTIMEDLNTGVIRVIANVLSGRKDVREPHIQE